MEDNMGEEPKPPRDWSGLVYGSLFAGIVLIVTLLIMAVTQS